MWADGAPRPRRTAGVRAGLAVACLAGVVLATGVAGPCPVALAAQDGSGQATDVSITGALEDVYREGLRYVDMSMVEALYEGVDADLRDRIQVDWRRFFTSMGREGLPGPAQFLDAGAQLLAGEMVANARLLARLVALSLLGAILTQLGRGTGGQGVQEVAQAAVLLALVLIGLQSLALAVGMVGRAVSTMTSAAQALLPTLSGLAAASGAGPASVAMHPMLLGAVTLAGGVLQRLVVPGLVLGGSLAVAGHVAPDFPISRLSGVVHQVALTALGLTLTIILGTTAVRGAVAPVADSVVLRTVKYVTGAAVPVVGRMMSEAVEVVAGGSSLIRSAVGAAGMMLVMMSALAPILKLLAIVFVYRLAAAVLQPVGDSRLVGAIGAMGDMLGLMLAALAATVVVFVLALTVMVGATSMGVLAR